MSELKKIIANNLTELRKSHKLTQAELASKLNYSDKSISKWERAEALPDIENLVKICELYNISLDYLIKENQEVVLNIKHSKQNKLNKIIITALSVFTVWLFATALFVMSLIMNDNSNWRLFIWAIPISAFIIIVFNSIWGKRKYSFALISFLAWSIIAAFYLHFLDLNLWYLYFLGLPTQVIIILWSQLKLGVA